VRKYCILHVLDSLGLGGAQEIALNLIRHADRERFESEIAAMHSGDPVYADTARELGVPVHFLSPHRFLPLYVPKMYRLCKQRQYDLIHCYLLGSNLIGKTAAAWAGVPVRLAYDQDPHGPKQIFGLHRILDGLANRAAHHVIAVSESNRRFLVRQERIPEDRITVVRNAVDLDRFQLRPERRGEVRRQLNIPENAIVIAGIGRLHYQKNFPFFLRVAARLVDKDRRVIFALAGAGPEEKSLRTLAGDLNLGERLRFLGHVKDIADLQPAFDIQLMTSRYEGLPVALVEGMAAGLSVVAVRARGVDELIENGVDGRIVEPGDQEGCAKALLDLIDNPKEMQRLGQAAMQKAHRDYSAEQMAREVEQVYLQCLEGN